MEDERNSAGEFGTRAKSGIGKKRRWIENIKHDKKAQNLEIRKDGLKYRRIKSNSILPSNTNWLEFNLTRC